MPKAVTAGFNHRAHMEKDADLDFLRDRADFRKLVDSLPKPVAAAEPVVGPADRAKR